MKKFLLLFFMCMFFVSLTSAAVQINEAAEMGIDITYPQYDVVKKDVGFTLEIHAYNKSNGLVLDDTTTSCWLHLHNSTGDETFDGNLTFTDDIFQTNISSHNFTSLGLHSFVIHCNSSGEGGFASGIFEVTPSGRSPPTEGESLIYGGTLLSMIFFSVFFFMLSLQFKPSKDAEQDEDGNYNPIPNDKPALRFGCLALSLIIGFIVLFYVMISLQNIFYGFDKIIDSYYIFMWLMGFVAVIIFIFVLISLLIQAVDSLRSGRGLKNV